MPRIAKAGHCSPPCGGEARHDGSPGPCPVDLAALARLSFSSHQQPLATPRLTGIPASYSYTDGDDVSLRLTEDFARLGLGSHALWQKHQGNPVAFASEALNLWLIEQGAEKLKGSVSFSLSLSDSIEDITEHGRAHFATIETDEAGYLEIGELLEAMETESVGLGEAFYLVLMTAIHQWVNSYSYDDACALVERWRESLEMDMEEGVSFEEHCEQEGITLPDITTGIPAFVVDQGMSRKVAVAKLQAHRHSGYSRWIELALQALASKSRYQVKQSTFPFEWDDAPLPSWMVAMRRDDGIVQCFDEEAQTMNESSRAPSCVFRFQPGELKSLRCVLKDIASFLAMNRAVAQIAELTTKWSHHHASSRKPRKVA